MITKSVLKETWRKVDLNEFWNDQLVRPTEAAGQLPIKHSCTIPNLDTHRIVMANGWVRNEIADIHLPDGILICSMKKARNEYADLIEKYMGKAIVVENECLQHNVHGAQDGLFIYVPKNVVVDKPIQIQSLINIEAKAMVELRNLIIVDRNAQLQVIHCDDSGSELRSFSNNVTEVMVGENAHVEYYKMQNLNNNSGLVNQTFVNMQRDSRMKMNCITLNGGHICNHAEVRINGEGCELNADGLYLLDKEQICDNYIFVDHAKPNCISSELYKGIIDDAAKASFNGHVLVSDGAFKTEGYQNNQNILLTDKAKVESKPFLEIYNDDVKCSHGSTIGQLDEQALFYLQTRGITERTARMMLAYAFCNNVIKNIDIEQLRIALEDMVKRRLHGELTPCTECETCSTPCTNTESYYPIDPSKL